MIEPLKRVDGSRNHDGVESKQQSSQRCNDRAFQKRGIEFHGTCPGLVRQKIQQSSGIVQKQTATELLVDSIRRVHAGELWMDSRTTKAMIQRFVEPADMPGPSVPAAPRDQNRSPLSRREREIVNLTAQGFKNGDMAAKLALSEQTVKNHLHNIFDKLGVTDRLELVLLAVANGLV
jgi:DNA-binding NarL/FixJ family response regulator